jgi:hypothetical protein
VVLWVVLHVYLRILGGLDLYLRGLKSLFIAHTFTIYIIINQTSSYSSAHILSIACSCENWQYLRTTGIIA